MGVPRVRPAPARLGPSSRMTAAHPAASHNGSDAARWRLIGKPSSGWPATTAARSRWPAQASRGHTRRHTICPTAPGTGLKNTSESIKAFSEADFTSDLQRFDVPTLVIHGEHGEHDQIVPVKDPARNSARLIKDANKVYRTTTTTLPPRSRARSTLTRSPSWAGGQTWTCPRPAAGANRDLTWHAEERQET